MQTIDLDIIGTRPLMQHNARLADPMDTYTKRLKVLTAKTKKTDDDHAEIARAEWEGGLYVDEEGVYVKSDALECAIRDAARESRKGKAVVQALRVANETLRIDYGRPYRGLDELWRNGYWQRDSVKVQTSRIIRTRPIFPTWRTSVTILYDEARLDRADIIGYAVVAGQYHGIGEWRPKHGTFNVKVA